MYRLAVIAQIIVVLSVLFVWVVRYDNIIKEFHEYGLPDIARTFVGALKVALATLLIVGIWYPKLVTIPALAMAFLMACAQIAHFKAHHPLQKYAASAGLLLLSLFVAGVYSGVLPR